MKYATNQHCDDCNALFPRDLLTTHDKGTKGIDLESLCDKCLSNYPKNDPREWRTEDHPDADGVITWLDGSRSKVNAEGIIVDIHEPYAQRGGTPTIGEIVAGVAMVIGMLTFFVGLTVLEGK